MASFSQINQLCQPAAARRGVGGCGVGGAVSSQTSIPKPSPPHNDTVPGFGTPAVKRCRLPVGQLGIVKLSGCLWPIRDFWGCLALSGGSWGLRSFPLEPCLGLLAWPWLWILWTITMEDAMLGNAVCGQHRGMLPPALQPPPPLGREERAGGISWRQGGPSCA